MGLYGWEYTMVASIHAYSELNWNKWDETDLHSWHLTWQKRWLFIKLFVFDGTWFVIVHVFKQYSYNCKNKDNRITNYWTNHLVILLERVDYTQLSTVLMFVLNKELYFYLNIEINKKEWIIKSLFKVACNMVLGKRRERIALCVEQLFMSIILL